MEKYQLKMIAQELFFEGDGTPVSLDKIIEKYNEDKWVIMQNAEIDLAKLKANDREEIENIILKNYVFESDFEFVDEILKRKEFPSFRFIFETSGEIIIENDLRDYFERDYFNVNGITGIVKTMEHYAAQGMLHGFVGNSCPGVYLSEERGEIYIGCDYNEESDTYILPDETFKNVAGICTDLWWYSIVDLENFRKNNPEVDTSNLTIVKIPAGKWELTHKYGISELSYHENLPYATLKKIK